MVAAIFISSGGVRCHLPAVYVLQPRSCSTSEIIAASCGICPLNPGKPMVASEIVFIPTVEGLRPVISEARVGEQSAVVWNCV